MSTKLAPRESKRATSKCQHRWIIETPHGKTSRGLCKRCGVTKRFPNAADDAIARSGGLGRWSANRKAARPKEITLSGKGGKSK